MKKILVIPVKNEEWILEYTLTCASLFFDHIIVADQQSTDRTPEICALFPKVVYLENNSSAYNEGQRRQLLLDAARNFEGYNFIANLAADEIFTANILDPAAFDEVLANAEIGSAFSFQWVQLWKNTHSYRDDRSMWSNLYRPFAFIDDRKTNYLPGFAHLSIVPEAYMENAKQIENIKVLHYQFVDFPRMLMKQRWARLLEFGKYTQPKVLKSMILNNKYYPTKDEHAIQLAEVPKAWTLPYPDFIKIETVQSWHADACEKFITEYKPKNLRWLDIWDHDWDMFPDERNVLQRIYHKHQYVILILNKIIPKWVKKIIKGI